MGSDGSIEYQWAPPAINSYNSLGTIHITANLPGGTVEANAPIWFDIYGAGLQLISTQLNNTTGQATLSFNNGTSTTTIQLTQSLSGKMLSLGMQASQPVLSAVYFSLQATSETGSSTAVPYYTGSPIYLPNGNAFMDGYFDYQSSNATLLNPGQALYQKFTNGNVNTMKERLYLSLSENIGDVFPPINNPVSTYRAQVAGRTVLDIWSQQNFTQISQTLSLLGDYGVNNCVVIVHGWQGSGYDNMLPESLPAAAAQGGNTALAQAIANGKALNCYVGLHENYVDYYPNYPLFTATSVALESNGTMMPGWLNPSTQIQSYATKPNWFVTNARTQSPEIHSELGTNADFLDVNSASLPWFRVDMDGTQSGAGTLSTSLNASKLLWNFERQTHGGPVFGEGLNHWYWSGLLDGVEAQFGAGTASLAEKSPLFVDFDLLKIHPLQVNHGMGMYERWLTSGEAITQTNLLDAYRMQEIIYGHAPYVESQLWTNIARVLLEQNLVGPVAARYGTQNVQGISYMVNGAWTNANAAVKANNWSQVQVKYQNGDILIANALTQAMSVNGYTIPQYGWLAKGTGLLAYTGQINGLIGDYSQTSTTYFANARNQSDLAQSGSVAMPTVSAFSQTGPSTVSFKIQWKVLDGANGESMIPFIHFVDSTGAIAFQGGDSLAMPSTGWTPGETTSDASFTVATPAQPSNGTYSMRIGLYSPSTNIRYQLMGTDDGTMRYILGNLIVSNGGSKITFQPQAIPVLPADLRLNGTGAAMNFGPIRTDGMIAMQLTGGNWELRAYPRYRDVTIQLNTSQFPQPPVVTCDSASVTPVSSGVNGYWQLHTNHAKMCQWSNP